MQTPPRSRSRMFKLWWLLILGIFCVPGLRADLSLVPQNAAWSYLDDGSDQGSAWRAPGFNDTAWATGASPLGYGVGDEATLLKASAGAPSVTTYFRKSFAVTNPGAFSVLRLRLRLLGDDGAVVFLNGQEVRRDSLPAGTIGYGTRALGQATAPDGAAFYETSVPPGALVAGNNVLAVEVHQGATADLSFNLELIGNEVPHITRGPYLQTGTPESILVRWRTDFACESRVRFGTSPAQLDQLSDEPVLTTEHIVKLSGLSPNTRYFYSVGSTQSTLAVGSEFNFFTAPPVGTGQKTRVWILGDSGTANANATAVRDGYTSFAEARYTDVWLMLGDNAYQSGTDTDYQNAVFDFYPSYLRQNVLWPTIGNHDTAFSETPDLATTPYFNLFSLPTQGEAGGVPSGTEKYYSFDYGRIHFICLDSMSSSRVQGSPMLTWLQDDLASTSQDWIIAFFHHPPYTKGSHNSDSESQLIEMRQNILPILEAGGVDLVLSGHSHNYERSFLINGHYGFSNTFSNSMKLDGGSGREGGSGPYQKPAGTAANQGAVYVVAGNGGQATYWANGSNAELNPVPHPAMYLSLLHIGSLVLDIDGNRLDAKMIGRYGAIEDSFSILKSVPNSPPAVSLTPLPAGAIAPARLQLSATATDPDGSIAQVDFYAGNLLVGFSTSAPFSVPWKNVTAGKYSLTAAATDNLGATTTSAAVSFEVLAPPLPPGVPPQTPAALSAMPGNASVGLNWNPSVGATSYRVQRTTTLLRPFKTLAANLSSPTFTDSTATNGATYFYTVSALNPAGESANATPVSASPKAPARTPSAPTQLSASAASPTRIVLAWLDSASNETGFKVERSLNGGPFAQIATLPANSTLLPVSGLKAGLNYSFRVRAFNSFGNSPYSGVASAQTPK